MSTARDHQRQQVATVVSRFGRVFCWLLHRFSAELTKAMADSHQKGMAWQQEFMALASGRGLHVSPGVGRADFVVAGKLVQCKAIDCVNANGRIDASNMRPVKSNGGHRGYLAHEYDVLALLHLGEVFLIPSNLLCDERGVIAGSVSSSFIRQFKDNWGVFDANYIPPDKDRQQTFFDELKVHEISFGGAGNLSAVRAQEAKDAAGNRRLAE
jgi:hypothetical protein